MIRATGIEVSISNRGLTISRESAGCRGVDIMYRTALTSDIPTTIPVIRRHDTPSSNAIQRLASIRDLVWVFPGGGASKFVLAATTHGLLCRRSKVSAELRLAGQFAIGTASGDRSQIVLCRTETANNWVIEPHARALFAPVTQGLFRVISDYHGAPATTGGQAPVSASRGTSGVGRPQFLDTDRCKRRGGLARLDQNRPSLYEAHEARVSAAHRYDGGLSGWGSNGRSCSWLTTS